MSLSTNSELVKAKTAYDLCLKKISDKKEKQPIKPEKTTKKLTNYNDFVKKISKEITGPNRMVQIGNLWQKEKRKLLKQNNKPTGPVKNDKNSIKTRQKSNKVSVKNVTTTPDTTPDASDTPDPTTTLDASTTPETKLKKKNNHRSAKKKEKDKKVTFDESVKQE